MRTVAIVICVNLLTTAGFAQDEQEPDGLRHSLTVDVPSFFLKTISVSYNYKLNDKYELRFNPRVSFDWKQDNQFLSSTVIKDPPWYYNSYMFQVGISRNWRTVYIEPLLYYKHGSFNDRTLQTNDQEGDSYDSFQNLSRRYNGGGIVLRSGIKVDKNHLRFNFFTGVGYYLRYYHEEINWARPYPEDPVSDYWKGGLTLHFGFEVGYRFGMTDKEKMGWPF